MRTKIILSIVAAYLLAVDVSAQTSITSQYNGYRDDDKLYRIVANDTTLGNKGDSCVWELPALQEDVFILGNLRYFRQRIAIFHIVILRDGGVMVMNSQHILQRLLPVGEDALAVTYGIAVAFLPDGKRVIIGRRTGKGVGNAVSIGKWVFQLL